MHLFLHAGQHKTGTSAIQIILRDHGPHLNRLGLFIPARGMNGAGSHRPLIVALSQAGAPLDDAIQREWSAAAGRYDKALVSAEYVKKLVVEGQGRPIIEGFRRLGATRISLLLYLRNPFELANSSFSQRTGALVNEGRTLPQHVEFLMNDPYYEYGRFLELVDPPRVELSLLPYGKESRRGINRHFFTALGLTTEWLPPQEPWVNMSYGPIALEAMRRTALELGNPPPARRARIKAAVAGIAARQPEPAPFWGIDDSTREALARADILTERFAQAVWEKPWRDVLPDERRPLNVFEPDAASPEDRDAFERLLREMRSCLP